MNQTRRSFRSSFDGSAEVAPEATPSETLRARATELSLHGCYLQTPAPFAVDTPVLVKIFYDGAYFESKGTVLYIRATSGMGVSFRDIKPYCHATLQKWILSALKTQPLEQLFQ